jgi:hypothetical protein
MTESPPASADVIELVSQDAIAGSPIVGAPSCRDDGPPPSPAPVVAPSLGVGGAP